MEKVSVKLLDECSAEGCRTAANYSRIAAVLIKLNGNNDGLALAYAECLEYIAILKERIK